MGGGESRDWRLRDRTQYRDHDEAVELAPGHLNPGGRMSSRRRRTFFVALGIMFLAVGCVRKPETVPADGKPAGPPEPTVTHTAANAKPGERIEHGEIILSPDEAKQRLHAQHHPHKVLETRRVPGTWEAPAMNRVSDFAVPKSALDVINPGPGEYVHVMEGRRHGYRNLTIGITWTA